MFRVIVPLADVVSVLVLSIFFLVLIVLDNIQLLSLVPFMCNSPGKKGARYLQ